MDRHETIRGVERLYVVPLDVIFSRIVYVLFHLHRKVGVLFCDEAQEYFD